MFIRLATTVVLAAVVGSGSAAVRSADYAPIQGAWKAVLLNDTPTAGQGVSLVITIAGEKYNVTEQGTVNERGTVRVDTTKTPMTMDLVITEGASAGSTQLGVFAVKGDTMTAVLAEPGATARPTSLAVGGGPIHIVMARQK